MADKNLQGIMGELGVCMEFDRLAVKHHIRYLHNVPLKGAMSMLQVDAVLLTPFGFYAVEIKNWRGIICCSSTDYYWNVTYGKREILTKSPKIQNAQHCRYLQKYTGVNFDNLIMFPDETKLLDSLGCTLHVSELENFLKDKRVVFTKRDIDYYFNRLSVMKSKLEVQSIADAFVKQEEYSR